MRVGVIGMDNQFSVRTSSLCFAPTGDLGQNLMNVVVGVEVATFREQLHDMKASNAPNYRQHEFRGPNRVTLSITWAFSRSKRYSFMVSAEIKPSIVEHHIVVP
jgi:hypothetical protein